MGEKIYKGGLHMANTGIPNVVPFQTQGGVVAPRKIIRSTLGTEDGIIDSMDKQGNLGVRFESLCFCHQQEK